MAKEVLPLKLITPRGTPEARTTEVIGLISVTSVLTISGFDVLGEGSGDGSLGGWFKSGLSESETMGLGGSAVCFRVETSEDTLEGSTSDGFGDETFVDSLKGSRSVADF